MDIADFTQLTQHQICSTLMKQYHIAPHLYSDNNNSFLRRSPLFKPYLFSISNSHVQKALVGPRYNAASPHTRTRNREFFPLSCSCSVSRHRCLIRPDLDFLSTWCPSTWIAIHAHSAFDARFPIPQPHHKSPPSAIDDARI